MKRHTSPKSSFAIIAIAVILGATFLAPTRAMAQSPEPTPDTSVLSFEAAASNDKAVIRNGYFVYTMNASETGTGSVTVGNSSDKAISVQVAAVDSVTAQGGGTAFATGSATVQATGTWLQIGEGKLTLEPHTSRQVYFNVNVPQATRPGQYVGGLAAYLIEDTADTQSTDIATPGSGFGASVTIKSRYVIAVQVDVPGTWTQSIKVESVKLEQQPSGPFIGVQIKNDGDTLLKPAGTVKVISADNKEIIAQDIAMGTFVPGTEVNYPVKWSGELAAGVYQVQVELNYGDNGKELFTGSLDVNTGATAQEEAAQPASIGANEPASVGAQEPATTNEKPDAQVQQADAQGAGFTQADSFMWGLMLAIAGTIVLLAGAAMILQRRSKIQKKQTA